jgi:hypothetical protein
LKTADAWGPPVSGSVAPRRALIGCYGRRCPNVPGGLKAAPTAPFGQPLSERTPSSPTAPLHELSDHAASSRRPDRRCPKPVSASHPRVSCVSVHANPLTRPCSSPPVVAEPQCCRRPRSPSHPTPPSTPSCRAAVNAPVSPATFPRPSPVRR